MPQEEARECPAEGNSHTKSIRYWGWFRLATSEKTVRQGAIFHDIPYPTSIRRWRYPWISAHEGLYLEDHRSRQWNIRTWDCNTAAAATAGECYNAGQQGWDNQTGIATKRTRVLWHLQCVPQCQVQDRETQSTYGDTCRCSTCPCCSSPKWRTSWENSEKCNTNRAKFSCCITCSSITSTH